MAGRFNWRDVAGTAKKWIDEKVTETVTTDRCEERAAEFRQRDLEQTLRDDVAVQFTTDDDGLVVVEPVDPAPVAGGELVVAGFAVARFHGPGRYELTDDDEALAPGANHVLLAGDDESSTFYWSESYGPGVVVAHDDLIEATLVCRNSADDEVRVTVRVRLG